MELIDMEPTNENLRKYGAPPLAQWLIHAARRRTKITYGEAKDRLENEIGFSTIYPPTRLGFPAGVLMYRMLEVEPDCPLLNILLVRQDDGMPGEGAGPFMADYLGDRRLRSPGFRDRHPRRWRQACEEIAVDVYAFEDWDRVYVKAFGRQLQDSTLPKESGEKDGIRDGRRGEGPNHRALRLWVKGHPGKIKRAYAEFRTETEFVLDSADRVDVVYFGPASTVAIEVKSRDSDDNDLRRGIFQCIKYRAVIEAMDIRRAAPVEALLVTQRKLPGDLKSLLRRHNIQHFIKVP